MFVASPLDDGGPLLGAYWALLKRTVRCDVTEVAPLVGRGPRIVAIWHGEAFAYSLFPHRGDVGVLVGNEPGAATYASLLGRAGIAVLRPRGNTPRALLRAAVEFLSVRGPSLIIAVDGPCGPANVAKPGIAWLSRQTGAPIVISRCRVSAGWTGSTWDRRLYPLPFSTVHYSARAVDACDAAAITDALNGHNVVHS